MEMRLNVGGQWIAVDMTDEELKTARRETLKENEAIINKVDEMYKDKPIEYRALLASQLIRHSHYKLEEMARVKASANKSAAKTGADFI
jgi:hypothetical protein